MSPRPGRWHIIVPLKNTRQAKTRLRFTPDTRARWAVAMAQDTIAALNAARQVAEVVVVCDNEADAAWFAPWSPRLIIAPGVALNPAITLGRDQIVASSGQVPVASLPADLPYLRPDEVDQALRRAWSHRVSVVADAAEVGTTLLTAQCPDWLQPQYGAGSLQRHVEAGARRLDLPASSGLRRDVDQREDAGALVGLGASTRKLLEQVWSK